MTQLETYTALAALWLAIAWLPYILDRIMVRGLMGALANYDPDATPQSAWAQRAKRAHKVGVEAFVAFAPLAVMAMVMAPEKVPTIKQSGSFSMAVYTSNASPRLRAPNAVSAI